MTASGMAGRQASETQPAVAALNGGFSPERMSLANPGENPYRHSPTPVRGGRPYPLHRPLLALLLLLLLPHFGWGEGSSYNFFGLWLCMEF